MKSVEEKMKEEKKEYETKIVFVRDSEASIRNGNLTPEEIRIARAYKNAAGNWKKCDEAIKQVLIYGDVIQKISEDLVNAEKKFNELWKEAFTSAPATDCTFADSPMGPARTTFYIKVYLKKLGWAGIRDLFVDYDKSYPFSYHVKEACRWLVKFKTKDAK